MADKDVSNPEVRIVMNQPAIVVDENGKEVGCAVTDVSKNGFRLKLSSGVLSGSRYKLITDAGEHKIVIKWLTPGEVGGIFVE